MGCFPCFGSQKKQDKKPLKKEDSNRETTTTTTGQSPVGSAVHLARLPSGELWIFFFIFPPPPHLAPSMYVCDFHSRHGLLHGSVSWGFVLCV
jgi:hypothetical protein